MGIGFNQQVPAYGLSLRTSDRCHDKRGSRHAFLARRVGVAIRAPSGQLGFLSIQVPPAGGLPRHQCAHWFLAMTGES